MRGSVPLARIRIHDFPENHIFRPSRVSVLPPLLAFSNACRTRGFALWLQGTVSLAMWVSGSSRRRSERERLVRVSVSAIRRVVRVPSLTGMWGA